MCYTNDHDVCTFAFLFSKQFSILIIHNYSFSFLILYSRTIWQKFIEPPGQILFSGFLFYCIWHWRWSRVRPKRLSYVKLFVRMNKLYWLLSRLVALFLILNYYSFRVHSFIFILLCFIISFLSLLLLTVFVVKILRDS